MPLTVVAVYHLRRLAGGIGIGEQEFMSLSFLPKPQIVRIQEAGQ